MMNRRLFLRLLLALSAAVGMSGSVVLLLERLGLLDSAQRPQIEAQRAEFEKAARKANTIEGAIVSRDGIPFTSASEPGKPAPLSMGTHTDCLHTVPDDRLFKFYLCDERFVGLE